MQQLFYTICILAMLPIAGFATDSNVKAPKGPNPEVKKYIRESVMPVLIQKRQEFDRELTASEKTEIAECRAQLKQLESQRHELKGWGKTDNLPGPNGNQPRPRDWNNTNIEQHRAIMDRLQAIADKHTNSLQDIKTALELARKQWIEDIKKLQPAPAEDSKSDNQVYDGRKRFNHGYFPFGFSRHLSAVHFLLLPTNLSDLPQQPGELKSESVTAASSTAVSITTNLTTFELVPNPASNDLQLGQDILPATNTLKIYDLQGKEILSLENVQASQHIDISQVASGTYLVQIKSGNQVASKKIIVSN